MNRPTNKKAGFTLVEIMIVVLIIGILLAIAIPNFVSARESSRAKACVGNLKQVDSAKQQSSMDNKLSGTSTATFLIDGSVASTPVTGPFQLVGTTGYIRATPSCPSNGVYSLGTVATAPFCGVSDKAKQGDNTGTEAAKTGGTDYQITAGVPGKFYHGLSN